MVSSLRRDARRRFIAALPMLAAGASARAAATRVEWTDVRLVDGRVLRAVELRRQTVVVEMWASWCPFCARQNPYVEKLHEASRERGGLLVLGVSLDKTPQAAREYLNRHSYTFATALATPQVERWFGERRTLPELYVIDPAGHVVLREEGEMFPEDIAALMRFAARR